MARYHGKKARVLMSTTGTGAVSQLVGLSTFTLDQSVDTAEVSAFGDPNKRYVQGLPDAKGSLAGFWDDSETKIWAGVSSGDGVLLYGYPDFTNAPGKYFAVPAWISASISVDIGDAVKFSGDWVANGTLVNNL